MSSPPKHPIQVFMDAPPSSDVVVRILPYFVPSKHRRNCHSENIPAIYLQTFGNIVEVAPRYAYYSNLSSRSTSLFYIDTVSITRTGCLYISVVVTGKSSNEYQVLFKSEYSFANLMVLSIYDKEVGPKPPSLVSCRFSDAGDALIITFNTATDMGLFAGFNLSQRFLCSKLFAFPCSSLSSCYFNSSYTVVALLNGCSSSFVGSNLTALGGGVCNANKSICLNYATMNRKTLPIDFPLKSLTVTPIITIAQYGTTCPHMFLSIGASIGRSTTKIMLMSIPYQ